MADLFGKPDPKPYVAPSPFYCYQCAGTTSKKCEAACAIARRLSQNAAPAVVVDEATAGRLYDAIRPEFTMAWMFLGPAMRASITDRARAALGQEVGNA